VARAALVAVDRAGAWRVPLAHRRSGHRFDTPSLVGVAVVNVPLEEILFYILTSFMLVQGFVIFWPWEKKRAAR
jgi:hypothetical protein